MKNYSEYIDWASKAEFADYMSGSIVPRAPGAVTASFLYGKPLSEVESDLDKAFAKILSER